MQDALVHTCLGNLVGAQRSPPAALGSHQAQKQFLEGRWGAAAIPGGKLGVSLLLTKVLLFKGATMAKLGPSSSFAL